MLILYSVSEIIAVPLHLNKNYFCLWQQSAIWAPHEQGPFGGVEELSDNLQGGQAADFHGLSRPAVGPSHCVDLVSSLVVSSSLPVSALGR